MGGGRAHLVGGPISILDAPYEAEGLLALPLHVQHTVDYVLQNSRARYVALLRHVPYEKYRDPRLLCHVQQCCGTLPHLDTNSMFLYCIIFLCLWNLQSCFLTVKFEQS
jgi:hypothetical protein